MCSKGKYRTLTVPPRDLAEAQALVSSAERQYERAAENLKVVGRQYELGDAAKADKLRAEANLLSAEKEVISARAGLKNPDQESTSVALSFQGAR